MLIIIEVIDKLYLYGSGLFV